MTSSLSRSVAVIIGDFIRLAMSWPDGKRSTSTPCPSRGSVGKKLTRFIKAPNANFLIAIERSIHGDAGTSGASCIEERSAGLKRTALLLMLRRNTFGAISRRRAD